MDDGSTRPVPAPPAPGGCTEIAAGTITASQISAGMITASQVRALCSLPPPGPVNVALHTGPPSPPAGTISGTGYARGGISAVLPAGRQRNPAGGPSPVPAASRGVMSGFDGSGSLLPSAGETAEIPDVYGTVRGYRWWTLDAPPLHLSPAHAEENWPAPNLLRGIVAPWQPGENVAECRGGGWCPPHDPALIPYEHGGCGYWAYWLLQPYESLSRAGLPVCGVVEGYGAVLLGTKGFRAARARIVALHLPFAIQPACLPDPDPPGFGLPPRTGTPRCPDPWQTLARVRARLLLEPDPEPDSEPEPPDEEQVRADTDRAEAWMAVIGDRLEQVYPGVRIFETREAMERVFPPDLAYVPEQEPCTCAQLSPHMYTGVSGHKASCPRA
jgi:hypothetical protein